MTAKGAGMSISITTRLAHNKYSVELQPHALTVKAIVYEGD